MSKAPPDDFIKERIDEGHSRAAALKIWEYAIVPGTRASDAVKKGAARIARDNAPPMEGPGELWKCFKCDAVHRGAPRVVWNVRGPRGLQQVVREVLRVLIG